MSQPVAGSAHSGEVRFGIVGLGNIGQSHLRTLESDQVPGACVRGVVARSGGGNSSQNTDYLADHISRYNSLPEMLAAADIDAVVVATPTHDHIESGMAVLQSGKHLLMEKPLAASVGQAQQLLDTLAGKAASHQMAAVMLNQRHHPIYRRIHELISSNTLGSLVRFNWTMTAWYRPDVYFQVSPWRGTWPGEGGGALLNQCIHNLDVLQWFFGLPDSVMAQANFGKFHNIAVEDEVSALLRWDTGMTGVLVASTGEAPGINQLDIVGDSGQLSFDGTTLTLARANQSVSEHCASTLEMFGVPEFNETSVEGVPCDNQHAAIFNNLVGAIRGEVALETPLLAGMDALMLANATLLSAWEDQRVSIPLQAQTYEAALQQRVAQDSMRTPREVDVQIDMDKSYR